MNPTVLEKENFGFRKVITSKTERIEDEQQGRQLEITLLNIPAIKLAELLKLFFVKRFSNYQY